MKPGPIGFPEICIRSKLSFGTFPGAIGPRPWFALPDVLLTTCGLVLWGLNGPVSDRS